MVPDVLERPERSRRRDAVTIALGLWMLGGVFADGWAHLNLPSTKESFFTPSHAVLYAGFLAAATWIAWPALAARGDLRQRLARLAPGYGLGFAGALLFGFGGVLDLAWHAGFGIEVSLEALLSPTHLLLLTGGLLVLTTPVRSAWQDPSSSATIRDLAPALVATALSAAIAAFFLAYAWGLLDPVPTQPVDPVALDEAAAGHLAAERLLATGLLTRLVTTVLLLAPLLLLARRWRLPVGTTTILYAFVGVPMAVLIGDAILEPVVPTTAMLVAGLLTDVAVGVLRPGPRRPHAVRLLGALAPALLWGANFVALAASPGVTWSVELWSGTVVMTALLGFGLALLSFPPSIPLTLPVDDDARHAESLPHRLTTGPSR